MGVWEPKDKPTVFSQIKKLIGARTGPLRVFRVCLYPGILIILVFLLFTLLTGCASMQWPWKKEETTVKSNPLVIPPFEENTIACIKLEPECDPDREN